MLSHYDITHPSMAVTVEDLAMAPLGQRYLVGTRKRTIRDVNFVKDWFHSNCLPSAIETMDESDLNDQLARFYLEARTKDDKQFTRSSLLGLRASLNRYLLALPPEQKTWQSILKNPEFATSNKVMAEMSSEERQRDKRPKSIPISTSDLHKLMASNVLSTMCPHGLQKKVWLDLVIHFGLRGNKAMWSLSKDSFLLQLDENGQRYYSLNHELEFPKQERYSEMKDWYWYSKMYEIPDIATCPVKSLNLYLVKLGPVGNEFFQRIVDPKLLHGQDVDGPWFRGPMGHQVVMRMMADISTEAGLSHTYTNTCVKATLNSRLVSPRGIGLEIGLFQYKQPQCGGEDMRQRSRQIHDAIYIQDSRVFN